MEALNETDSKNGVRRKEKFIMSDPIKHECGVALMRLKKPLEYYQERYGTWMYGIEKMYLLMEKQHNRGQDGAGLASVKFHLPPGYRYVDRARACGSGAISEIFNEVHRALQSLTPEQLNDPLWAKSHIPFAAELYLGHLRYGTYGDGSIDYIHPQIRSNNWKARTLIIAGNFNLTNTAELFELLIRLGQHPKDLSDMVTVMEKIGHFLDVANERLFRKYKDAGCSNIEISRLIAENLDLGALLSEATKDFDGGYALAGLIGHGDAFVCRDPWGIRPAFYLDNEEVTVVASERPAIQTAMDVGVDEVHEILPGQALIIKRNGRVSLEQVREAQPRFSCSLERIYFSRGTDQDIYRERLRLGTLLAPEIMRLVGSDLDNTVFSFIPNTAEAAYYGLLRGLEAQLTEKKINQLMALTQPDEASIREILCHEIRSEKVAVKDVKLRTFITQDAVRQDMVQHVYDVTYGSVKAGRDTLVIIDDSIVRGTTLRESILRMLDRLNPRRIVVVSSAPQIRYPDCYGIDMAKLGDLIAFKAAEDLLKTTGRKDLLQQVYENCLRENARSEVQVENRLKDVYAPFTDQEISDRIAILLTHPSLRCDVNILFQTVEGLHDACPNDRGDWYFTGNYPTPGGARVANQAFINYMEGRSGRAY